MFKQKKLTRAFQTERLYRGLFSAGVILTGFTGLAATTAATAQDAVEEIVVTARFRSESVQEAPLAITAITGEMLQAQNIKSVEDLGLIIPNSNIRANGGNSGPDARIGLRGVEQTDFMVTFEPGVAVYVDDIYHGTLSGSTFDLMDLERVEVLRGPQGTLFGKNSLGGAIRLFSKAPSGEDTGHVQLIAGTDNRLDMNASYDFGIIPDELFMRVSGSTKFIDGYQKRLDYTCQMKANGTPLLAGDLPQTLFSNATSEGDCEMGMRGGQQSDSGKIMLRWLPSDRLSVDVSADYSMTNDEPVAESLIKGRDPNPSAFSSDLFVQNNIINPRFNANGGQLTINGDSFVTGDPYTSYASFVDPIQGRFWSDDQLNENWNASARFTYEISEDMQLKGIYGFRTYDTYWNNGDQTPFSFNNYTVEQFHEQTSFELQLSGMALNDRLEWTTGLYDYESKDHLGGFVTFGTFGLQTGFADFDQNDSFTSKSKSVFVHGVYDFSDRLSLTGGMRYTTEDKTYTFDHTGFLTLAIPLEYGQSNVDWKVSLDYQVTDDMLAYGMVSTGFRSEGANPRPWNQAQLLPTPGEEITAYELGLKADFFDNKLRVNTAAFINDYDPRLTQTLVAQCTDPNGLDAGTPHTPFGTPCPAGTFAAGSNGTFWFYYTSAPGEGRGFEIEATAFPIENLMMNFTYGYYRYESSQPAGTVGFIDPSAKQQADDSFNAGVQYSYFLGNGASIVPRLDWFHQGERTNGDASQPRVSPWHVVPDYDLLNFRVTYENADKTWVTSLEVQNLLDKFYWIDIGSERDNDAITPTYMRTGLPSRPRQIALSFRRNF